MKALIHSISQNTFIIRNSHGLIFQIIGHKPDYNTPWQWMVTFLCNHSTSPNYVIMGTSLKNIPPHVMRQFKILQRKHNQ